MITSSGNVGEIEKHYQSRRTRMQRHVTELPPSTTTAYVRQPIWELLTMHNRICECACGCFDYLNVLMSRVARRDPLINCDVISFSSSRRRKTSLRIWSLAVAAAAASTAPLLPAPPPPLPRLPPPSPPPLPLPPRRCRCRSRPPYPAATGAAACSGGCGYRCEMRPPRGYEKFFSYFLLMNS